MTKVHNKCIKKCFLILQKKLQKFGFDKYSPTFSKKIR